MKFVDESLSTFFDSVLSPLSPTDLQGPMPRELALRRLTERTARLLRSEGYSVDPKLIEQVVGIVDRAAIRYRLSPALILSVIHSESGFRRYAVSPVGAVGFMQILPDTAHAFAAKTGLNPDGIRLFDPETNIVLGTAYLRHLIDRFRGDLPTALAAYHLGPTEIGRRMIAGEAFSDRYGKEIRVREAYCVPGATPQTTPSNG